MISNTRDNRRFAMRLFVRLFLVSLLPFFIGVGIAHADSSAPVNSAVSSFKGGHHVYVDSHASPSLSASDASKLANEIDGTGDPIYIAILPDVGDYNDLPARIGRPMGIPAVVAVISGHHFRGGSGGGVLGQGVAGRLATDSFNAENPGSNGGKITPLLLDFVDRVHAALHNGTSGAAAGSSSHHGPSAGKVLTVIGIVVGGLLLIALLIWAAISFARRRAEEREAAEREAQTKADFEQGVRDARAKYNRVQDKVLALPAGLSGKAKTAQGEALDATQRADQIILQATTKRDLTPAYEELGNAEQAVNDANAYVEGRDPVKERAAQERQLEVQRKAQAKADAERAKKAAAERAAREAAEQADRERRVAAGEYQHRAQRSSSYSNYFGGGTYQGQYYAPGYYQDPFWTFVEFEALENIMEPHDYDRDDYGSSSSNDSGGGGGNDWDYSSSSSSSSSGGGDWGFDSGGGGGGDFGGGGSDSSGGGGDW